MIRSWLIRRVGDLVAVIEPLAGGGYRVEALEGRRMRGALTRDDWSLAEAQRFGARLLAILGAHRPLAPKRPLWREEVRTE